MAAANIAQPESWDMIIKRTQVTLGKIIKKPPLKPELLQKPPFRFLFDIIHEVITTTGFMQGLYTEEELTPDYYQDRDTKSLFLEKALFCVIFTKGQTLKANPLKILAGLEPERTNSFLQALGICLLEGYDSTTAVQRVLSGERPY
ncbi:unnamed protein product [Gordionus sp. m RMFG-2023]|uniref:TRAF3-interacting protein 1-like n=1 Tax=Gordionus sp. m RMFG-2023 TaxID=3053472 RepID=UPI0030E2B01A